MKITPLEIRQKQFERTMRGYDKEEVTAFLISLSQEWERAQDEVKEIRVRLESTEREVTKLREVESSLYKTLKTAEDTGSNMIEQANKAADLHMKETQLKAQEILNEAKNKAEDTIEMAEETARQKLDEMEDRLKTLVQTYKNMESQRDNLLSDLKRIAHETLDRVERVNGGKREFDADQHLSNAKREAKKALYPNSDYEAPQRKAMLNESAPIEPPQSVLIDEIKFQRSFFDDIQ